MFKFIPHFPKLLVHNKKQKPEEYTSLQFAEGMSKIPMMEDSSTWMKECVLGQGTVISAEEKQGRNKGQSLLSTVGDPIN